ncbi:nicotinamide riboside transporter PnuC [Parapedobacter sp. 10938]|uniref:nicotinamide riboside transporter PnuC n=1 Tax=Parapedobacter flavus TaxID=3110225 RepID=UPI002DBA7975|nr:nicotinamide riboside transporter PnuC [Parapedobacter sp. 10938]MEC3878848.1 nicotinamide riboside transporter PnuC [Parapedobacter sp. 10938]
MADVANGFHELVVQLKQTPLLHWVGVVCGVIQVLLAKSNKVLLYPFGIASILVTIYVLYEAGLYAEILLNGYYLVMSIYGWVHWVARSDQPQVVAGYSKRSDWYITLLIVTIGFPLLYFGLLHFTDSTVPVWDAWVSATAWAGMWLLAQRKIENWVWLNVSNTFAIPLLAYKGLHLYALLTLFLFIVAIFGYIEWKRIIRRQRDTETFVET